MTNETMTALNYIGANIQIYGHFACYSVPYRNGESITTTREISREEFLALTYEYLSTNRVNCDYGNDMAEQSATKRFIMSRVNDQSISLGATWVLEQEWLKVNSDFVSYNNNVLRIHESDTQDTIVCKCTHDQLEQAIKKIEAGGIHEENLGNIPAPKNNWRDVAEYNEKIGYASIVVNDEDRLQIAKVTWDPIGVIIIKHIGSAVHKQCNLQMSQEKFLETLKGLV